ncbi:hypothetical protein K1X84_00105 [bacterium]|nr:hypothetical protein [bacterium]
MAFGIKKLIQYGISVWKDPVWSKVIATVVIGILLTIYSILQKLNIDFTKSVSSILTFKIDIWIVILVGLILWIAHSFFKSHPAISKPETDTQTTTKPEGDSQTSTIFNFNYDENDILSAIQSWMSARPSKLNTQVISFSDVDNELGLLPGSTQRYIEQVAQKYGYTTERKGSNTILFKIVRPEQPKRNSFFDRY